MEPGNVTPDVRGIDRRRFGHAALAVTLGAACPVATLSQARAADDTGVPPDIKAIRDRGQLIVGMSEFDSSPFYYTPAHDAAGGPTPALEGPDVQLANDLAQVLGVKLVLNRQGSTFNAVVDQVIAGTVDLAISKLSMTPKRAVLVRFSQPTIELRHALLANRLSLAKRTVDGEIRSAISRDFDGTIGVIAKSSYADIARAIFTKADVREFDTWSDVVDAVERNAVELAYRDELEIKKLMRQRPDLHLNLKSVLITDIHDSIAVAVPSRSTQLLSVVNVVLAQRPRMTANQLLDDHPDIFQKA